VQAGVKPKKGSLVTNRAGTWNGDWLVEKIGSTTASLRHQRTGEQGSANVDELIVVKPSGEAIYPCLTPVGKVAKGGDRPWHAIINGENYHALQLLLHLYEGKADCLYLDPHTTPARGTGRTTTASSMRTTVTGTASGYRSWKSNFGWRSGSLSQTEC
jgi:adenine-specific DNA-methyltransferase